jgi:murein DD-endopeptidase MepM/ murein hydrolase activator NlpD
MNLIVPLLEPQMTSVFSMPLTLTLLLLLHASAVGAQRCADLAGDFRQGGLLWGQVTPSAHVALDDASILVLPNGTFVLGLGRDAPKEQVFSVVAEGQRCTQTVAVAQRQYNIQRVEGVPQKTVTPPNDVLERIARERALVRKAKAQRIERPELLEAVQAGLSWPATGRISGVYGSQRFYNGTPGSPHYGVDVAVPTGHPVVAPGPGVITLAEVDLFYSGGTIILDHGYGLSSSFLHLSKLHVEVGQEVQRGDLIGEVGATGRATGPHLDWRMSWLNQRVDPQLLVPAMPLPD